MWIRKTVFAISICAVMFSGCAVPTHAADPCDRTFLQSYIDKVLAAMIAHNPNQFMLSRDICYTENSSELKLF